MMVATILPRYETGEPDIRVRRSLFGKLIVQVRYPIAEAQLPRSVSDSKIDRIEKLVGIGKWRDASASNFEQVIAILTRLDKNKLDNEH